jgi:hypothetical protein
LSFLFLPAEKSIPEVARTEVEKKSRITKAETKEPQCEKSRLRMSSELRRNIDFSYRGTSVSAFVILDFLSTSVLAISGIADCHHRAMVRVIQGS